MCTMARRDGPVHVATTARKYKGKTYRTHLLRRTYREGDKVKHETVGNLSHLPDHIIDMIRAALRGELPIGTSSADLEIVRTLPHGHVAAVLGTLENIGLDHILASRSCKERTLCVAMIVARIIAPSSKLATVRGLREETLSSSLGPVLEIEDATEDQLYEAMDWLAERQQRIENKLAKRHLSDGSLVLYDVSSSYYTGTHCELAEFGHNRDGKNGYPQIVYGLLCNAEGCPVAVEVFDGNTGDPTTLGSQIQKVRRRFGIQRVVFVGDRGMITSARIDEEMRGVEGLDWITALRAPAIASLLQQDAIQPSFFDHQDLVEITSEDYPGERLIVCRNPLLAEDRARTREDLLVATEKELDKIVAATQRDKRALRGKDKIGVRVGKVINRFKVGKHFLWEMTDASFSYRRDQERIAQEAKLDGLYVIRTSVDKADLDAEHSVRAYKDLAKVERAFRCFKTVDLKVRPIFHRLPHRVRAHVFLCMLAYYVEWHMRAALAPVLFDEDDVSAADAMRDSIVAQAQRSPSAQRKAASKRTHDDFPVHSFQTLLDDLATIAKNRVRHSSLHDAEFFLTTLPTPPQKRALDLLRVSL
jgi:transposase